MSSKYVYCDIFFKSATKRNVTNSCFSCSECSLDRFVNEKKIFALYWYTCCKRMDMGSLSTRDLILSNLLKRVLGVYYLETIRFLNS